MYYLFGTILTHYGSASLNHGKRRGNISPLQKSKWHNKVHSTVNADSIRWSLRYFWQQQGYEVNRVWDTDEFTNTWTDESFDPMRFIDDDVLGYLRPKAVRREFTDEVNQESLESKNSTTENNRNSERSYTKHLQRLGALGANKAFSLIPFNGGFITDGNITFNSKSGQKDNTSLHFIEFHNTRYQYAFALDCNHLKVKQRVSTLLDGLMSIRKVGGHNNVFCYDFSPESMVLRWTQDNSPEIFYCFEQLETRPGVYAEPSISEDVIDLVTVEDINPHELWIGGKIAKNFELENAHIYQSKKKTISELKKVIAKDLKIKTLETKPNSN